jgi:hypothetical protein
VAPLGAPCGPDSGCCAQLWSGNRTTIYPHSPLPLHPRHPLSPWKEEPVILGLHQCLLASTTSLFNKLTGDPPRGATRGLGSPTGLPRVDIKHVYTALIAPSCPLACHCSGAGGAGCELGLETHLQWEHHKGHADHDDHQKLGWPDLGCHVTVSHRGEGDDAEVKGGQQVQVPSCSLQVLDATGPGSTGGGAGVVRGRTAGELLLRPGRQDLVPFPAEQGALPALGTPSQRDLNDMSWIVPR